mmetsp:Transcript_11779/g.25859  ORF Transcript_11779/g.25859 Transcript_11779/m.25859 type:complete len:115 (-) Transcript_11779:904-1248(-)
MGLSTLPSALQRIEFLEDDAHPQQSPTSSETFKFNHKRSQRTITHPLQVIVDHSLSKATDYLHLFMPIFLQLSFRFISNAGNPLLSISRPNNLHYYNISYYFETSKFSIGLSLK